MGLGAFVTIKNNTKDAYMVKMGADEAAFHVAKLVSLGLATIATAVTTAGAGAPLAAAFLANGVVEIMGISIAALIAITSAAATVSGIAIPATIAGWAVSTAIFLKEHLKDDGYVEILPGEKHLFDGTFLLSTWRQAACRRVRVSPFNSKEVVMDVVYMRPILSTPTSGSAPEHDIQFWINKRGHEESQVIRVNPAQ